MATAKLPAGYEVDTLTRQELGEELDSHTRNWFQEMARGVGTARFPTLNQTVASESVSFPATGDPLIGPKPGYCWAVQRVSALGLSTGDTLQIYRGAPVPSNFLGQLSAANPTFHVGSKGVILRDTETISVLGASLTATGVITLTGEALECSELDIYKLIA
jgi:hypothetical protein